MKVLLRRFRRDPAPAILGAQLLRTSHEGLEEAGDLAQSLSIAQPSPADLIGQQAAFSGWLRSGQLGSYWGVVFKEGEEGVALRSSGGEPHGSASSAAAKAATTGD